jgi:hypothetical protein
MKTFLIQYTISDDSKIKEKIKALGSWMSYFKGFWLVETDKTAEEIYDILSNEIPETRILVLEINIRDYWGWMPKDAWEWIKKRKNNAP